MRGKERRGEGRIRGGEGKEQGRGMERSEKAHKRHLMRVFCHHGIYKSVFYAGFVKVHISW